MAVATESLSNGKQLESGYAFWYHSRRGGKSQGTTKPSLEASESPLEQCITTKQAIEDPSVDQESNQQQQTPTKDPPPTYESSINVINTINTVEDFWRTYDFLVRPNDLPNPADYHFFREGIKPTWEDTGNSRGGKWIVRLKKGLASRYWEETLLALIGVQFQGVPEGEICGAVVSIRYSEDIVSIWNKNADDITATERIRDAMKKILHLPHNVHMEYKPHQASLQDKSSFRNTTVWKPKSAAEREQRERERQESGTAPQAGPPRRTGSWAERGDKNKRETERAWR